MQKILRNINIPQTKFKFQRTVHLQIYNYYQNRIISRINTSQSNWSPFLYVINPNKKVYTTIYWLKENLEMAKIINDKFYSFCCEVYLHIEYSKKSIRKYKITKNTTTQYYTTTKKSFIKI